MKVTKFFALVAALFAVGCTNNPNSSINPDDTQQGGREPEVGVLALRGKATQLPIFGAEGGNYDQTWGNRDSIGVFSPDGFSIQNLKASKTGVMVDASGQIIPAISADFLTQSSVEVTEGDNLYVYHPYREGKALAGQFLAASLPAEQTQKKRNIDALVGDYAVAYDVVTVGKAGVAEFQLEYPLAYVMISIGSTEFAHYNVKSIELVDRSGNAKLAGDFYIDLTKPANDALIFAGNASSSVKLNIAEIDYSSNFSQGGPYQFWLTVLPTSLVGCDAWVIIELEHSATKDTATIPVKYPAEAISAGGINVVKLENLSSNDSATPWFAPVDSRLMPALGYAYGEANTYLIQCKSGTYKGATFTPDANIPGSVRIDIRGRGEFSKIVDVRKATFEWAKNKAGEIYTLDNSNYPHINSAAYTIDDSTKAEGYISVTNNAAHAGAPILLMKLDGKVIWSWTFWNIAADGTSFGDVTIGNHTYANMLLGQSTMQYETWSANMRSNSTYPDFASRTAYVYQWGRPTPQFWQEDFVSGAPNNNQIICQKSPTVEDVIAHPETYYISDANHLYEGGVIRDLWGDKDIKGAGTGAVCIKSVYDPCPKGYRVADYAAAADLITHSTGLDETSYQVGFAFTTASGGTHKYLNVGYPRGIVKDNGTLDVYGWGYNAVLSGAKYCTVWTNASAPTQSYAFYGSTTAAPKISQMNGDCAMAIRCMKDTDNR